MTHPRWLARWGSMMLRHGMPHFENMEAGRGPPVLSRALERNVRDRDRLSWEHVRLMRQRWKGRLVLKGIVRPDDAVLAREHGIDGVIVSNHGGRQLDGTIAPLRALPEIAEVAGNMVVMLDGGIRRGTDVLKALALGADFVFIGRPFLYAAAVGGETGVAHAISLLSSEIHRNMALLGILSPAEMSADLVALQPSTISST
jgi:L-lactate dehydrogenase (cytochrome)